METDVSGKILYNLLLWVFVLQREWLGPFCLLLTTFGIKMGPFLLIVFDLANLGKAIFYVLLFLALVSINPRQADSSVSNYTGPEDDWTATILAFLSKGKSNLFLITSMWKCLLSSLIIFSVADPSAAQGLINYQFCNLLSPFFFLVNWVIIGFLNFGQIFPGVRKFKKHITENVANYLITTTNCHVQF